MTKLNLTRTEEGIPSSFAQMEKNVYYVPSISNFAYVDGIWKDEGGTLHAVQVSKALRHPALFQHYLDTRIGLCLDPTVKFKYHYLTLEENKREVVNTMGIPL